MLNGQGGEIPEWYLTLRAADRIGIDPTELEKPSKRHWIYRGLAAEAAEKEAEIARQKHNEWLKKNGLPQL